MNPPDEPWLRPNPFLQHESLEREWRQKIVEDIARNFGVDPPMLIGQQVHVKFPSRFAPGTPEPVPITYGKIVFDISVEDLADAELQRAMARMEAFGRAVAARTEQRIFEIVMQPDPQDFNAPDPSFVAITGRGTYQARERLKQLGGFWNPALKAWMVPEEAAEEAWRQVALGRATDDTLPPDPNLGPIKFHVVCWQCGVAYRPREFQERGGNVDEYYCGCVELETKRRQELAGKRRPSSNWPPNW